jgi:hypothetical protein
MLYHFRERCDAFGHHHLAAGKLLAKDIIQVSDTYAGPLAPKMAALSPQCRR